VIITDPNGMRWVHLFPESTQVVSVGRDAGNDVRIDDPRASRRQLVLRRKDRTWSVEDTSGRETTRLNGLRLDAATRLSREDEVGFGQTKLELQSAAPHASDEQTVGETWSGEAVAAARGDIHLESESPAYENAVRLARRVAASPETVLIRGETGTGKEVFARLIHEASPRADGPLVVVNCPGLSESLVESELFGVEGGVATGVTPRPGKLASADGGTVLLDEIGDLTLAAQAKLLRFLQDKTVDRVGGAAPLPVDARVVAATNIDLEAAMADGRFRQDLYHRLAALTISLPPLRERRSDIPRLVRHFLARTEGSGVRMNRKALEILERHAFPGNVRELELVVRQSAFLRQSSVIGPEDLPEQVRHARSEAAAAARDESPHRAQHDDAGALYERLVDGGEDFWDLVRTPFLKRELSRKSVQTVVGRALSEAGSYAGAARLFRVEGQYRKFVDFLRHNQLQPEDESPGNKRP
jgi:transcriptional regulator with PAS, ATPase and Fis domain